MRGGAALLALALAAALACSGEPATPEERVRTVLAEIERAAEARDLGASRSSTPTRAARTPAAPDDFR